MTAGRNRTVSKVEEKKKLINLSYHISISFHYNTRRKSGSAWYDSSGASSGLHKVRNIVRLGVETHTLTLSYAAAYCRSRPRRMKDLFVSGRGSSARRTVSKYRYRSRLHLLGHVIYGSGSRLARVAAGIMLRTLQHPAPAPATVYDPRSRRWVGSVSGLGSGVMPARSAVPLWYDVRDRGQACRDGKSYLMWVWAKLCKQDNSPLSFCTVVVVVVVVVGLRRRWWSCDPGTRARNNRNHVDDVDNNPSSSARCPRSLPSFMYNLGRFFPLLLLLLRSLSTGWMDSLLTNSARLGRQQRGGVAKKKTIFRALIPSAAQIMPSLHGFKQCTVSRCSFHHKWGNFQGCQNTFSLGGVKGLKILAGNSLPELFRKKCNFRVFWKNGSWNLLCWDTC